MEGIWVVLSKTAVITWLIVLVSGSILAIVIGIVEYRDLKKGESAAGEDFEVTATDRGIITECEKSNCCAAVTGILESEREKEQLRKKYDELKERYKNLQAAYEGQREDFEDLEKDYRALDESNNKLISEHEELKKENEAHWRQLTQIMRSNPEVFEQFSGEDESEQELIDNGYVVK